MSGALALMNIVPCYALDGQWAFLVCTFVIVQKIYNSSSYPLYNRQEISITHLKILTTLSGCSVCLFYEMDALHETATQVQIVDMIWILDQAGANSSQFYSSHEYRKKLLPLYKSCVFLVEYIEFVSNATSPLTQLFIVLHSSRRLVFWGFRCMLQSSKKLP